MKKLITAGTMLFMIFISGNVYASNASDGVVVLIKVERALKLEIGEKHPESIPPQRAVLIENSSRNIRKDFFPVTLTHTVTE